MLSARQISIRFSSQLHFPSDQIHDVPLITKSYELSVSLYFAISNIKPSNLKCNNGNAMVWGSVLHFVCQKAQLFFTPNTPYQKPMIISLSIPVLISNNVVRWYTKLWALCEALLRSVTSTYIQLNAMIS